MKKPTHPRLRRLLPTNRRGVALVTVLTVMSLTTILVLTFFTLASSEHRASTTYSYGLQAQQVAEQAVNMVVAQIREATTVSADRKVWSSQPGAIRTFETGGNFDQIFKLYSDDVMKSDDVDEVASDFGDINTWDDRPDHFVDLNEPVIRGEKVYYPVVDPTAAVIPEWPGNDGIKDATGEYDANGVEGFKYDASLVEQGEFGRKAAQVAKATDGHIAMPVRWLYQLADGTIGTLKDGAAGADEYQFEAISGSGLPSEKNQIVARFAFWADDESSKLNINTHAGGAAWDLPRAGGAMDRDLASYQPARNEWQRYPGHPATTHLSPALAPGYLLDVMDDGLRQRNRDALEKIFAVVPRVVGGGSESGTRKVDPDIPSEANGLQADTEPLYPSLDDMVMGSDREAHVYPNNNGTDMQGTELGDFLERSKFFVTAYSRAPEVNLFNLPRVAIWPIYNASRDTNSSSDYQEKLTAFDRLIHYCASVGNTTGGERYDYIFKREKADSPTHDFYNITRNRQLYEYLDELMGEEYPGFGGSFAGKYGDDQEQILTQIFDYIRSTNIHDDSIYAKPGSTQDAYQETNDGDHWTFTNWRNANGNSQARGEGLKGHGQVVPIQIGDTRGFGRFHTLASAQIVAICAAQPQILNTGRFPGVITTADENVNVTEVESGNGPSGKVFLNVPPKPTTVQRGDPSTWPTWVEELQDPMSTNYNPDEFEAVFRNYDWNWQLAFNYDAYRDSVIANPTANKFNPSWLSDLQYAAAYAASPGSANALRLASSERMFQGALLFNLFTPSIGWVAINPDLEIELEPSGSLSFAGKSNTYTFLGFEPSGLGNANQTYTWASNWVDTVQGARRYGGLMPFQYMMAGRPDVVNKAVEIGGGGAGSSPWINKNISWTRGGVGRLSPIDRFYGELSDAIGTFDRNDGKDEDELARSYQYDLVTLPFKADAGKIGFNGGDVTFKFFPGRDMAEGSAPDTNPPTDPLQTIVVNFPNLTQIDTPTVIEPPQEEDNYSGWGTRQRFGPALGKRNRQDNIVRSSFGPLERASLTADPANPYVVSNIHKAWFHESGAGEVTFDPSKMAFGWAHGRMGQVHVRRSGGLSSMFGPGDVVQSIEVSHGDMRLVMARKDIGASELFMPHRYYDTVNNGPDGHDDPRMSHSLTNSVGNSYWGFRKENDYLIIPTLENYGYSGQAYGPRSPLPFGSEKSSDVQLYGDFDSGIGLMNDGPYINKPDEGNISNLKGKQQHELDDYWATLGREDDLPYFTSQWRGESGGPAYFSPNRIVSGPGMFGSLSSGVKAGQPWRTLLFRPNVNTSVHSPHYGAAAAKGGQADPPDHVLMDLFWMPVVEPYAISEPLSTAGKVNMNYQMAPFLHIDRATALVGVLRSEYMAIVPNTMHRDYKHRWGVGHKRNGEFVLERRSLRSVIEDQATLVQFEDYFDGGRNLFKSSTEICDIHLIPEEIQKRFGIANTYSSGSYTPTKEDMESGQFWEKHSITGENGREKPYTNIQQRLTTKSNTFKVHFRAQVLKQARRDEDEEYKVWRPEFDTVQAEYRGSSIVERFVDPNHPNLPDFATNTSASIDEFYQYRIVNPRRFAP